MERTASRSNGCLVTGDDERGIWCGVTKGIQESAWVILLTLEILLLYDPSSPCKFEITGTTCRYNVQELEPLI